MTLIEDHKTSGLTPLETDAAFIEAARPYWHPVAAATEVEPGAVHAVTLLGEELALWRGLDGRLGIVADACAHRGVKLSHGAVHPDGCISCPYHGWRYADDGHCAAIPQMPDGPIPGAARVPAYQVDEHAGLIWVRLADGDEVSPRPELLEAADPEYALHVGTPFDWKVQSTRQVENFLDVAHFSHIHLDVFGNPEAMEVPPQQVEIVDGHLYTDVVYPGVDPIAIANGAPADIIPMAFAYDVHLPFAVLLRNGVVGEKTSMLFMANQPVTAHTCRVWWVIAQPVDVAMPPEIVEMMEQLVFGADQAIVETQRPDAVPLALTEELHLPFDKVAVAYRRALASLGFPSLPPSTRRL